MNKKVKYLIGIILIVIFVYLFYKVFTFNVFSVYNNYSKKDKAYKSLNVVSSITIDNLEDVQDYLEVEDIKIRNDFKDYELKEDKKNKIKQYILYSDKDKKKIKSSLFIGKFSTYKDLFKSSLEIDGIDNYWYKTVNRNKLIKDNNIENDLDLFKYVKKFQNKDNKINDKLSKMQENYACKFFVNTTVPLSLNMTIIDGKFTGYIFNNKDYKTVNILKNKKRYTLTFYGDDLISEEYLKYILSTLVIGE